MRFLGFEGGTIKDGLMGEAYFDGADDILEQVDNAEAVLLSVSAFNELAPGVQGVDVGIIHGDSTGKPSSSNGTEVGGSRLTAKTE